MGAKNSVPISLKDGEPVLACAHAKNKGSKGHFYGTGDPIECVRPDGSKVSAKWIILCSDCHERNLGDPLPFISADYLWIGDEPITVTRLVN